MAAELKLQGSTSTPQAHTNSHNNRKTDMNQQLGNTGRIWEAVPFKVGFGDWQEERKEGITSREQSGWDAEVYEEVGEAAVWPETIEKYIKYIMLSLLWEV